MGKGKTMNQRRTIGLDSNPKYTFWRWLRENASYGGPPDPSKRPRLSREEIGGLFIEYLLESEHSGWDGFNKRDIEGIRRMLEDVVRYDLNSNRPFNRHYFTGSCTYPGSPADVEFEIDNRDPHTTWLRIKNPSDLKDGAYIEVDPFELFRNAIENNFDDPDADKSDIYDMLDFLNAFLNKKAEGA